MLNADTIKMLSILNGILLKSKYLDYNERHSTAVATVQRVADILNSPLFASLLDIREQWKKVQPISSLTEPHPLYNPIGGTEGIII